MKRDEMSRFDTRLPKDQKELFEYAANLGGFRTLTEFLIFSPKQEAGNIIGKYNTLLASKKDQEIFFDTITNPQKPNDRLRKAAIRFNNAVKNK